MIFTTRNFRKWTSAELDNHHCRHEQLTTGVNVDTTLQLPFTKECIMGTICDFEADLFPPNGDGFADTSASPTTTEVLVTSFYGPHQIFLRMTREGQQTTLHLTKEQARDLSEALATADARIGYDNTVPSSDDD